MFIKPYKLRSSTTLKNTEKKLFIQRILDAFPAAPKEAVKDLVPSKSTTLYLKLIVHSGETVMVYAVDGVPLFIVDPQKALVPTVCALWKIPDLVPIITIHTLVLTKIINGAPLFLPGVVVPPNGVGFPMFARGAIIAASTTDNASVCLVGRAAIGSADMLLKSTGVCLETIQAYGDLLCKDIKFHKLERPVIEPTYSGFIPAADSNIINTISELTLGSSKSWAEKGEALRSRSEPRGCPLAHPDAPPEGGALASGPAPAGPAPGNNPALIEEEEDTEYDDLNSSNNSEECESGSGSGVGSGSGGGSGAPADMDGLLRWCVLGFLKRAAPVLPLRASLLYRNYLIPMCPPDRTLDVKKSTYKKIGKFLDAMQREGLLEVKEVEKGVFAVVKVYPSHPAVRGHRAPRGGGGGGAPPAGEPRHTDTQLEYEPPQVREMLCVTAAVVDLFPNVKKGTALLASEVRVCVSEYVRARGLAGPGKGTLTLDATLANVLGKQKQEVVKWDALMGGVESRMTAATRLQFADGRSRLVKSRLDPISMQVANRSGNKKVTLVNNLEAYGFSLPGLAVSWQRAVGAACIVTRTPGAKAEQVMLQGDQTHFVAKMLIEKYGLPKKFVDGADKALNKKK